MSTQEAIAWSDLIALQGEMDNAQELFSRYGVELDKLRPVLEDIADLAYHQRDTPFIRLLETATEAGVLIGLQLARVQACDRSDRY